jgi:hypothetical protein
MKLRALVIGLLLANLLVAAWFVGFAQDNDREPERLQQQVKPQTVRVVPRQDERQGGPQGASRAASGAPAR